LGADKNKKGDWMKRPVTIQKKGAMFFTVDAMVAAIVLSITAILVISFYVQEPVTQDTFIVVNNYVDYITDTKMETFTSQYRYIYSSQNETDTDLFVYQKIAKLHMEGKTDIATNFTKNITENIIDLVPQQFSFEYYVDGTQIYQRALPNAEYAITNISHRILTYYTYENDTVVGPLVTRITIWS